MKIKFKNYFLLVLFTVFFVSSFLSFMFITKSANAQTIGEEVESENNYICYDIKDGATGTCYPNDEIEMLSLDSKNSCLDYSKTHGPGRENGGTGLLDSGCRNYMGYNFTYGTTDIPYWINMESINLIANSAQRAKILADIREQAEMWNHAFMYDGKGQIVNIYEITSSNKPSNIDGRQVIEVLQNDLTADNAAGIFYSSTCTIELDYDDTYKKLGYNVDTVLHEFGHALGLRDIDSATGSSYGTHKTLMGYSRGTTPAGLKTAIKYQDVQGIAVMNGRHTCYDSHFMRYVKVGSEYRHICFYCDRIDNRTSIISGSKPMGADCGEYDHDYQPMVSCGERRWDKCTKCYKVIEISGPSGTGNKVTLRATGNTTTYSYTLAEYGKPMPELDMYAPPKEGYALDGYYDFNGKKYYEMRVVDDKYTADLLLIEHAYVEKVFPVDGVKWDHTTDVTLYARWTLLECDYTYNNIFEGKLLSTSTVHITHGKNTITPVEIEGYKFSYFQYGGRQSSTEVDLILYRSYSNIITTRYSNFYAVYEEDKCLAAGSLITLADGRQVAIEDLTGDEMLLVWNLYTGTYDVAPILFIDSDPMQFYKVINLSFSDCTVVKVISEHGFWDYDLNKYVYLDKDAAKYIGHWFNKGSERVQLVGVEIKEEYTSAWSPVTYGHLCYFVNGMLSMPGGINGLFNIFEVDPTVMKYDEALMLADIEQHGLFTYEEFIEYFYLPQEAFEAFNGQYMKVAIGKGLITMEELALLYNHYSEFLG